MTAYNKNKDRIMNLTKFNKSVKVTNLRPCNRNNVHRDFSKGRPWNALVAPTPRHLVGKAREHQANPLLRQNTCILDFQKPRDLRCPALVVPTF
jgi:hypothetical protein